MWSARYTTTPPPRLVFNVTLPKHGSTCLRSKLKPSMCNILSSLFLSRSVSHKTRMSNLDDEFKRSLISSNFGFMWQILILATCKPVCLKCRHVEFSVLSRRKSAIRLNSHFCRILGKGTLGNGICSKRRDALYLNFQVLHVIHTSGLSQCRQAYC